MRVEILLFVLLGVSLAVANRFTPGEYQASFTQWMRTHGKSYDSTEFTHRYTVYQSNMDYVDEFNQRNETFTVGLNAFADLTIEEFTALLLNPIPQQHAPTSEAQAFSGQEVRMPRTATVDWRTKGAVTAIKNQGSCGSCWTFSASGAIESECNITGAPLTAFSEQNLLDCVSGGSCNGGSFISAFQYVISNGGIDTMASYPYTGTQGTCHYSATSSGGSITSYQLVTPNNEAAMANAVASQPVSVAIQGSLSSFQLYKSGTYSDSSCTASPLNHAVIAIGYGTDTNGDYWIIKNSWGTSWGMSGFAQMARGVNMCGIASQPAFPSRQNIKGWMWQDYLFPGYGLQYSGTVTSFSESSPGVTGVSISASIAVNSRLIVAASPATSTSGFSNLCFSVMTSASSTVSYTTGSTKQSTATTTAWKSVTTPLSSLGSPSSVSSLSFYNAGTATATFYFDNIHLC